MTKITFCICTYDNHDSCKALVNDFHSQKNVDFKLIVQDNTPYNLREYDSGCLEKTLKQNQNFSYIKKETDGLSGSRNLCLDYADTEYVHFLDDDVRIDKYFVSNVINSLNSFNFPVALGSKVLPNWSNIEKPYWFKDEMYPLYSMLDFGPNFKIFRSPDSEISCWWLAGANLCLNRKACISLGGFNNSLGRKGGTHSLLSSEETELLINLSKKSDVFYCSQFPVLHDIKQSRLSKSWLIKRCAWQSVSDILTNDLWQSNSSHQEERVNLSIESLANRKNCDFSQLLGNIQYLTYKILMGEI